MLELNVILHGVDWGHVTQIAVSDDPKVGSLRREIHAQLDLGECKPSSLLLWNPQTSVSGETYDRTAFGNLPMVALKLDPTKRLSEYFPPPISETELHIIVEVELSKQATHPISLHENERKSKRGRPLLPTLVELEDGYLDRPLTEDQKVPIHPNILPTLITADCSEEFLRTLFYTSPVAPIYNEKINIWWSAVNRNPPLSDTEGGMMSFWDRNLRDVVESLVKSGQSFRDSNRLTDTKLYRPDYGFSLRGFCPLRGEEKCSKTDGDPEQELSSKLVWTFDPAEYVFGYSVRYTDLVICAILRPEPGAKPVIRRLARAELGLRSERVKNLIRLIHLCELLPLIADLAPRDNVEFFAIDRIDRSILLDPKTVQKTFKVNPTERIAHLERIYQALRTKEVRNVNSIYYLSKKTGTVILEPRGRRVVLHTTFDLFNVIKCVLEGLVDMHTDPPIFHRDVRWANIIQDPTEDAKYFLIDFDDATGLPTKARKSLEASNHCETVFHDNHGPEVDLWAVGKLILETPALPRSMYTLGHDLHSQTIVNAQDALDRLLAIEMDCRPSSP